MKKLTLFLSLALIVSLLAGCAGTPVVYYSDCTCPTGSHVEDVTPAPTQPTEATPAEGELLTGLYIGASVADSVSATAEENGEAAYGVDIVAVTVDADGIIRSCIIDSVKSSVKFDAAGTITTDLSAEVPTKNELGEGYGMKLYGGSQYEWNEQAAALADYAVGKTVEELKSGAVDETGHAADADLASTATIYIGGYVAGIEAAVANAQSLGAQAGDELRLAVISDLASSTSAEAEKAGNAQLNVNVVALTLSGETITSCVIDAVQAKVAFDQTGAITSDITAAVPTKTQLGDGYGMVAWGGAIAEWYEQIASFCAYCTGKTADEVMGIAVSEGHAADADLAASVTISIGDYQALIEKAAK